MSNSRWHALSLKIPSESGPNWLDPLITSAKGISSLSALSPFPFVGQGAESVALLLDKLQKTEKNRDDLRQLAQRLVAIIVIIRDDIIARGEIAASGCKAICLEFISYLDGILRELSTTKQKNKHWLKRHMNVNDISDTIKTFEDRIHDLRNLAMIPATAPYQPPVVINCTHFEAINSNFYHSAGNQYNNIAPSAVNSGVILLHEDVHSPRSKAIPASSPALMAQRDDLSSFRQDFRSFVFGDLELIRKVAKHDEWTLSRVRGKENKVVRVYKCNSIDYSARISGFETTRKHVRVFKGPEARKSFYRELSFFADIRRGGPRPELCPSEGDGPLRVAQLFGISESESMCPALIFHNDLQTIDEYMASKPAITCLKYENRWWLDIQDAIVYLNHCFPGLGFIDPLPGPLMITSEGRLCITRVPMVLDDTLRYGIAENTEISPWEIFVPELLPDVIGPHHHDMASTTIEPQFLRRTISELLVDFLDVVPELGRATARVFDDPKSFSFQSSFWTVTLRNVDCPLFRLPSHVRPVADGYIRPVIMFGPPDHYPWESFQVSPDLIRFTTSRQRYWGSKNGIAISTIFLQSSWGHSSFSSVVWLAQANHLMKKHKLSHLSEDLTISFGVTFFMKATSSLKRNPYSVYAPDETFIESYKVDAIKSTPPPEACLFLLQGSVDDQGCIHFPRFYWSDDPNGLEPQAKTQYSHLDTPSVTAAVRYTSWKSHHYEVVRQFHAACGFDPDSDEAARHLRLPILEFVEPQSVEGCI